MILLAATAGRRDGKLLRSCGACAAVGILALTACQGAGQAHAEAESEVLPSSPALHQVNDVRLREIMRELSELELTDIAIQMKQSGQPHPELRRIAEMAVPLARDARVLSITFRSTSMPPESRRMFDALAMQLRDEASSLADAAERQNVSEVNKRLHRVIATCNACHAAFRGPSIAAARVPTGGLEAGGRLVGQYY